MYKPVHLRILVDDTSRHPVLHVIELFESHEKSSRRVSNYKALPYVLTVLVAIIELHVGVAP